MSKQSNYYLETLERMEKDIAMVDAGAFYASAAVSLKRIADALEKKTVPQWYPVVDKTALPHHVYGCVDGKPVIVAAFYDMIEAHRFIQHAAQIYGNLTLGKP